jgi:putative transposase
LVDVVRDLSKKAEIPVDRIVSWLDIQRGRYYDWAKRYGLANEHNHAIPRDTWLEAWEKEAIVAFFDRHPLEGYRRLTYMMMDENIVAVSPATVHRVLKAAGRLGRRAQKPSGKGKGFEQPQRPHEHWHTDISQIKIDQKPYFLATVLDGASRAVLSSTLQGSMTTEDIELLVQKAREQFPGVHPRLISDNGPQFVSKDLAKFLHLVDMTHVRTSPYYPQSNGKQERFFRSLKEEALNFKILTDPDKSRKFVEACIHYYNHVRLHSAIGYVTPWDFLEGKAPQIHALRDQRLDQAREQRKLRRQAAREAQQHALA